ncbi:hypothetical protein ACQP2Y_46720 (plasmid) [Actinoplanes sp. CA-051413]|uniref:hypothetical protein n=1 Tax=Actinoplanes sp. CA-051413 TaxID=3239899 RepID=UPI003D9722A9
MDTPTPGRQHLTLAETPADHTAGGSRWRQAFAELPAFWRDNRGLLFIRDNWLFGAFGLAAVSVLGLLLWLIWVILTAIVAAIGSGLGAAGSGLAGLGAWITGGPVTTSISDPVRAYLDAHTTGLPATGRDLWIVWIVAVGVLYAGALAGSTYARIGWAAIGALSAAAAYFGAATGSGPAAAGLTVTVWLLLSLLAYARAKSASVLEQIALDLAARRAAREQTATR